MSQKKIEIYENSKKTQLDLSKPFCSGLILTNSSSYLIVAKPTFENNEWIYTQLLLKKEIKEFYPIVSIQGINHESLCKKIKELEFTTTLDKELEDLLERLTENLNRKINISEILKAWDIKELHRTSPHYLIPPLEEVVEQI